MQGTFFKTQKKKKLGSQTNSTSAPGVCTQGLRSPDSGDLKPSSEFCGFQVDAMV